MQHRRRHNVGAALVATQIAVWVVDCVIGHIPCRDVRIRGRHGIEDGFTYSEVPDQDVFGV